MNEHTPRPQPPAPAPEPHTPEPRPRPWNLETHPLSGLEMLAIGMPDKPHAAEATLREPEEAWNSPDVDVNQSLLSKLASGDSLPDVPLPEGHPDASVGVEWTGHCVAEEEIVVAFRLRSGSYLVGFLCSNLFMSGIDYYTRREVFELLRVYFIYGCCIGFIWFIVLWDIAHVAFLERLICKEPPFDGIEAQ